MIKAPESFLVFCRLVNRIVHSMQTSPDQAKVPSSKVSAIPYSARQLARRIEGEAAHFESAEPVFKRLAEDLFGPVLRVENLVSYQSYEDLAELLKRSGFYHDVRRDEPPQELWDRLEHAINSRPIQMKTLLCLAGCYLPKELTLGRFSFTSLPAQVELRAGHNLGPLRRVLEDFYPNEAIEHTYCTWLVETTDLDWTALESSHKTPGEDGDLGLDRYWRLILPIALYNSGFFRISTIVTSIADWKLNNVRQADPNDEHLKRYLGTVVGDDDWIDGPNPGRWLVVPNDRWDSFRKFFGVTYKALAKTTSWKSVNTASREYLRARFADCPEPNDWELCDFVLRYVVAMEKLLLLGHEENRTKKFSCRGALAVACDSEKPEPVKLLKRTYEYRSQIVHGGRKLESDKIRRDLPEIRDVCRRAFAGMLLATASFADEAGFTEYRRELLSSAEFQELAERLAKQVLELTGSETSK